MSISNPKACSVSKDTKGALMDKIKTYQDCSDAMLKMWIEDILTDGEYNHIIDKLNVWYKKQLS